MVKLSITFELNNGLRNQKDDTKCFILDGSQRIELNDQFIRIVTEKTYGLVDNTARRYGLDSEIALVFKIFDNPMHWGKYVTNRSSLEKGFFEFPIQNALEIYRGDPKCPRVQFFSNCLNHEMKHHYDHKGLVCNYGLNKPRKSKNGAVRLEDFLITYSILSRREGFALSERLDNIPASWYDDLKLELAKQTFSITQVMDYLKKNKFIVRGSTDMGRFNNLLNFGVARNGKVEPLRDWFPVNGYSQGNLIFGILYLGELMPAKNQKSNGMPERRYLKLLNGIRELNITEFYKFYFESLEKFSLEDNTIFPRADLMKVFSILGVNTF